MPGGGTCQARFFNATVCGWKKAKNNKHRDENRELREKFEVMIFFLAFTRIFSVLSVPFQF